jgi:hypothetical protein
MNGEVPQHAQLVELRIVFNPITGNVAVHGPIDNKLACYGLLGMARDVVATFDPAKAVAQKSRSLIIPN